jgi:hypothetical protein
MDEVGTQLLNVPPPWGRTPFFFQTLPIGPNSFGESNREIDQTKIPTFKMDNKWGWTPSPYQPEMGSATINLVNFLTIDLENHKEVKPLPYYTIIEGDELHKPWAGVTMLFRLILSVTDTNAFQIGENEWQYTTVYSNEPYDYSRTFVASDFKLSAGFTHPNRYDNVFPYGQEIVTFHRTFTSSGFPLPNSQTRSGNLGPWQLISISPSSYEVG